MQNSCYFWPSKNDAQVEKLRFLKVACLLCKLIQVIHDYKLCDQAKSV